MTWTNPFVERMVGSIRRECLDHMIVLNEDSLRFHLRRHFPYYQNSRTQLSMDKDAPEPRAVQTPSE